MTVKGSNVPVSTTVQGETSYIWSKDGITALIIEKHKTEAGEKHIHHSWENVTRVAVVDETDLCSRCKTWLRPRDGGDICYRCMSNASMLNPVTVNEHRGQASTMYDLTYPKDLPFDDIVQAWHRLYHPAGYNTVVKDEGVHDDVRRVKVSRWNSCD